MELVTTRSEQETISAGKEFAKRLRRGDVVALYGELGTGKTRFVKGMCLGLGVHEHVASPTFTILREYKTAELSIYHFDLYRIASEREILELGFEEFVNNDGICFIEWADRAQKFLLLNESIYDPAGSHRPNRYDVHLKHHENPDMREITIEQKIGENA